MIEEASKLARQIKYYLLLCFSVLPYFYSALAFSHPQESITTIEWPDVITDEMLLGKRLFSDKILSAENSSACVTCHQFEHGGSSPESHPVMTTGYPTKYNSPSIFNLNTNYRLGWVANLQSAGHQLNGLVEGQKVMGLSWAQIVQRLNSHTEYKKMFQKVYASAANPENITQAITRYEHALTTPSPFDRYLAGDQSAVSEDAIKGYDLFKRYGCISCHQGRNVGGNLLQKLGVIEPYKKKGELKEADLGRYNKTKNVNDMQVFRVPPLRNVANTGPYLHDGSIDSLRAVIILMAKHQLGRTMTDSDVSLIEAFLHSLTGSPHPELIP